MVREVTTINMSNFDKVGTTNDATLTLEATPTTEGPSTTATAT